jgi:hypothetical protein
MSHSHSHDGSGLHSHSQDQAAADHGHTHEILDGPGSYMGREMPIIEGRNWSERAFTVGIGGYVPSSSKCRRFDIYGATNGHVRSGGKECQTPTALFEILVCIARRTM